ncbi:MAG: thioredoxin family protein [Dehalococcoidaceae bacterium]|nr:thioredoxin family protein [Dehalococcoidaceae bacterium]|tara:strand:+ start:4827 stop:5042 length:216 start_codon:yes stop_codon:yes gene_type:complete
MKVSIYVRKDCHLCEEAISFFKTKKNMIEVEIIDIDLSQELINQYNDFVPVIKYNNQTFYPPIDYKKLELI